MAVDQIWDTYCNNAEIKQATSQCQHLIESLGSKLNRRLQNHILLKEKRSQRTLKIQEIHVDETLYTIERTRASLPTAQLNPDRSNMYPLHRITHPARWPKSLGCAKSVELYTRIICLLRVWWQAAVGKGPDPVTPHPDSEFILCPVISCHVDQGARRLGHDREGKEQRYFNETEKEVFIPDPPMLTTLLIDQRSRRRKKRQCYHFLWIPMWGGWFHLSGNTQPESGLQYLCA